MDGLKAVPFEEFAFFRSLFSPGGGASNSVPTPGGLRIPKKTQKYRIL